MLNKPNNFSNYSELPDRAEDNGKKYEKIVDSQDGILPRFIGHQHLNFYIANSTSIGAL